MAPLDTPVALIFFNRADTLAQVMAVVRQVQPRQLFLIADGPRRPEDVASCAAARRVVADDQIDWNCQVTREYSETNLGCRQRIISGLGRLFDAHPEAIILEDDCLPDASFFPYAASLLEKYRDQPDVMFISGSRYRDLPDPPPGISYQFVGSPSVWGWAAWRRTWKGYDPDIGAWPSHQTTFVDGFLDHIQAGRAAWRRDFRRAVGRCFDLTHAGVIQTWDYQLVHHIWSKQGKCIIPATNLVVNIGFDRRATHTAVAPAQANPVAGSLDLPLRHPPTTHREPSIDQAHCRRSFLNHAFLPCGQRVPPPPAWQKWRRKIYRLLGLGDGTPQSA